MPFGGSPQDLRDLDYLGLFLKEDVDRRYGPQPGDGKPPVSLPVSLPPLPEPMR